MNSILFEIHSSKFKPDPISDTSQATNICKSHRMLFFGVSKHTFNGFFTAFVKSFQLWRMPVILCLFKIFKPEMFGYQLSKCLVFSAFVKRGTVFAKTGVALVFTVAVTIGGGIIQNLVFGTKNTIKILI